jgi:hypothetical protein
MISKPLSEEATQPLDWRVPSSAADVRELRRAREQIRPWPLDALNRLAPPSLFPVNRNRRTTSAGAEPFRL